MSKPGVTIGVDSRNVLAILSTLDRKVIDRVKKALDLTAAAVKNLAQSGHPKVRDSIQGAAAAPLRQLTGPLAGEFAFKPRFLTRTGNLRNSIQQQAATEDTFTGDLQAAVFSGMEYADDVEFGTVDIPPYPFMTPALISSIGLGRTLVMAALRRTF